MSSRLWLTHRSTPIAKGGGKPHPSRRRRRIKHNPIVLRAPLALLHQRHACLPMHIEARSNHRNLDLPYEEGILNRTNNDIHLWVSRLANNIGRLIELVQ